MLQGVVTRFKGRCGTSAGDVDFSVFGRFIQSSESIMRMTMLLITINCHIGLVPGMCLPLPSMQLQRHVSATPFRCPGQPYSLHDRDHMMRHDEMDFISTRLIGEDRRRKHRSGRAGPDMQRVTSTQYFIDRSIIPLKSSSPSSPATSPIPGAKSNTRR